MKSFARFPGASLAVGAFVLTVLLGAGAVSASALWQQSATATMTVTANGTWPGAALASLVCTNDNPEKVATIKVTATAAPATITYAAVQANGTLGTSFAGPIIVLPGGFGNIVLTGSNQASQRSQILNENPAGPLTVRVTATYADNTTTYLDITLNSNLTNGKITCPLAPVLGKG